MIRLGTINDVSIIDPFDPFGGSREEEVSEERMHVFVNDESAPIAYISTANYAFHGYPYVSFLLVHPQYRRRGIATKLLHHIEGLHAGGRIFISTESDNPPMLALLRKEGYRLSGALSGLNGNGVDEVFFFKDL